MFWLVLSLFLLTCYGMGSHDLLPRLMLFVSIPVLFFIFKNKRQVFYNEIIKYQKIIFILVLLVSSLRVAQITRKLLKEDTRTEDIAVVYEKSINLLFKEKKSPYGIGIDPYPLHYQGRAHYFDKPKYPPLQILTYAPFTLLFGLKGIYLGNLIVYLFFIIFLFQRYRKANLSWASTLFILASEFVFNKLFSKGVNDLLPAVLVILSLLNINSNHKRSGIYLGLSFLAKQLPAGLVGLWFLSFKKWKSFLICSSIVVIGLAPLMAFHSKDLFENLVLFNLLRPVRETSLLLYLPTSYHSLIGLIGLIGAAVIPSFTKQYWFSFFLALVLFITCSKMSPGNYYIWPWCFLILYIFETEDLKLNNT